jgi:hypothetical protein
MSVQGFVHRQSHRRLRDDDVFVSVRDVFLGETADRGLVRAALID